MSRERPVQAGSTAGRRKGGLATALELMLEALRLLDKHNAPREVGAHLDLAIHRLREAMDHESVKKDG